MKISMSTVLFTLLSLTTAQSTVSASPPTTTYALTPQQSCLASCQAGDVNCQAACIGSAHPNSAQVSLTNECAASCVQGNGSTAESNLYAQCVAACISSYYPTSQTVAPVNAASSASVAASVTGSKASSGPATAATGSATSGTGSGTATGTAAGASVSKAAGATSAPYIGLAGFFMAALAL